MKFEGIYTPVITPHREDGSIDRAADLPITLYNYPGRMGIMMGEEFLDRVGRSRNFCAIKESSGDINRVHLLARDYPHVQLSCGMDDQALEFFAWGARNWVCGGSNFRPAEHIALYRACAVEGNFDKGRRIMSAMLPLMRVLEQGGKFVQCIKYGCEIVGHYAGPPRPPLKPLNKDDKRQLEQVAACGPQDVDFAVAKAREAFDDGRWSRLHPKARKEVLIRLAKLVRRNARELAVLESLDSGKTIYDCELVDVPETINCLTWHAELIDKIYDQVSPASDNHIALIVREPVGVVGLVLPWNFPLLMLAWKIGPALAAGCSVIVKPAEETPLTALRMAELAIEAGVPRGVFNVLPGTGPDVGEPIGRHMDIDAVSFTGSTETGRRFLRYAADSNLKEVTLEMGGKNPAVVLDDAEDLDRVAAHVVNGAFWNMGENCSASSRLIVQKGVREALLARIVAHAREWPMGDPLDPMNRVGALVSKGHFDKVCAYLDKGQAVLLGGTARGGFVEPTILDVTPASAPAREEIFGPVLSVLTVETVDEAIALANDTEYGLAASIFTANIKRALRGARAIRAGTVTVNSFGEGDISTPFGGFKHSGFGGRDTGIHAHDQYTQIKTIWVDLADDTDEAVG